MSKQLEQHKTDFGLDLFQFLCSPRGHLIPILHNKQLTIHQGIETSAATLAFVEPCVGIICACLPVMRTLLSTIFSPLISALSSHRSSHAQKARDRSSSSRTVVAHESQDEDIYPLYPHVKGVASKVYGGRDRGFADEERGIRVTSDIDSYSTR